MVEYLETKEPNYKGFSIYIENFIDGPLVDQLEAIEKGIKDFNVTKTNAVKILDDKRNEKKKRNIKEKKLEEKKKEEEEKKLKWAEDKIKNEEKDLAQKERQEEFLASQELNKAQNKSLGVLIQKDGGGRSVSDLCKDVVKLIKDKNILFYRPNSRQIVEIGLVKNKIDKTETIGFIT